MKIQLSAPVRGLVRRRLAGGLVLGVAVILVLVAGTVVGVRWWRKDHPEGLLAAINAMPVATQRLSFTDWKSVRTELRVSHPNATAGLSDWLQTAFEQDLSPASIMASSAPILQRTFGFSPAEAAWEAYGAAPTGQVEIVRLDDDVDFAKLREDLTKAGYPTPSSNGIWAGGSDRLASIDPSIPADFANIALLPDQHLVLASSSAGYLAGAIASAKGNKASLNSVGSLTDMVGHFDEPAAAVLWVRDFVCADLAMSNADQTAQTEAQQAITAAGQTTPLVGFALALGGDGVLTAAEQFTSSSVAQGDLKARAALATGPEYGRSDANFSDDFTLQSARTEGSTILLRMKPHSGVFPLSSLYSGPLVFATC